MKMICITFRSITPAQQGQRVLQRSGVEAVLQRTPRWMEEKGCGYCLRLRTENWKQAVWNLRQSGLSFQKIYALEDGKAEEVVL